MTNTQSSVTKHPSFVVKLMRSEKGSYPIKIGVTFPTEKGNHRLSLDVIPASIELKDSILILTPYEEKAEPQT